MNLDVCLLLLNIVFYRQKLLNCNNIGAGKGQKFQGTVGFRFWCQTMTVSKLHTQADYADLDLTKVSSQDLQDSILYLAEINTDPSLCSVTVILLTFRHGREACKQSPTKKPLLLVLLVFKFVFFIFSLDAVSIPG